jgi:hypothetical protein
MYLVLKQLLLVWAFLVKSVQSMERTRLLLERVNLLVLNTAHAQFFVLLILVMNAQSMERMPQRMPSGLLLVLQIALVHLSV